jgi:hypothetical protein
VRTRGAALPGGATPVTVELGDPWAIAAFSPSGFRRRRCSTIAVRWYTWRVPTARPRHQITETPAVARALDLAARRWPEERRSRLVVRLIEEGGRMLEDGERERVRTRREAVRASSGKYADAYPVGYLAELREDWPE